MISANEEIFNEASRPYQQAIREAGHSYELKYECDMEMSKNKKNKNRKRHILWYNPPYCRSVKTNIGKNFLQIVSEAFPKSHKLNKILNRNTLKISYCCLPNVGSKILADAMNKYRGPKIDENTPCINHRGNKECPVVGGKCNLRNNVYNAKIITNNTTFNYIGIS